VTHYRFAKRTIDVIVALILAPIWITLTVFGCLVVLIVSPGNPFFVSDRVGQHGNLIAIYKIRTMVKNAAKIGSGITTLNDRRIIPLGRLLRLTKIDEMPQFFSVLKGDLSIVGPRPELAQYVAHYTDLERDLILSVRPGMVDFGTLAFPDLQTTLGPDATEESFLDYLAKEKIRLRLKYVEKQSLSTDLKILMATPFSIIKSVLANG
jgi:lipopolysaccharide/colanic/teichoic acid biosynthesis glycosyltransferase